MRCTAMRRSFATFSICCVTAWVGNANTIPIKGPDTQSGTRAPFSETGTPGSTVTISYSNGNQFFDRDIKNMDGTLAGQSGTVGQDGRITFDIPAFADGLAVNDVKQRTSPPNSKDPGTLYIAVFSNGFMNPEPLTDWLQANGYGPGGNAIFLPDFFAVGLDEVYYGVNLADVISSGQSFVTSHSFGETFALDASGRLPELPMYIFSSTPLTYTPGVGWTGTPLAAGALGGGSDSSAQVEYVAFHTLGDTPEPSPFWPSSLGLLGIVTYLRLRHSWHPSRIGPN